MLVVYAQRSWIDLVLDVPDWAVVLDIPHWAGVPSSALLVVFPVVPAWLCP